VVSTPSEKYESQLGLLFPIYGKIKNVPNHQPASPMIGTHLWDQVHSSSSEHLRWNPRSMPSRDPSPANDSRTYLFGRFNGLMVSDENSKKKLFWVEMI
jgi:hypothetical protein